MRLLPARRRPTASVSTPLRTSPRSLAAAGYRINRKDAQLLLRLRQEWQQKAFFYYDVIPELKFASQFYARMLEPLRIYPTKLDDAGEWVELTEETAADDDDRVAIAQLERWQDPGGGRTGLLGSYGRLMFIAGEATMLCTRDPRTQQEQWEILSTDEVRVMDGTILRYKAPSIIVDEYREPDDDDWETLDDDTAIPYRLWKRHPRFSWLPDATMMGVLDVAEELYLLTLAVAARARSRMAGSGILFLDSRIAPPPAEPVPDEDANEDPLMADIIAAVNAAISEPGAASAIAPIIVRVPIPESMKLADMVYHLQIVDPMQLYPETGLRLEAVKRLAIGLDMPAEILTGLGDVNHWGSWQIEDQTWKSHGMPIARNLCDDLRQSFYQPSLEDAGIAEWWRYGVGYDEAAIVVHPDRSKDARDAFSDGELSGEAYRRELDFSEDDAPSEDERNRYIGVKIRDGSLAVYGIPSVRAGGIEPAAGELESGTGVETVAADKSAEVAPGPPPTPTDSAAVAAAEKILVARLSGAVDLAVLRAREAAGNRVLSLAKRDPAARDRLDGVRTALVPATLGREAVRALRAPSDTELVAGCGDLVADTLRLWGIADPSVVELVARSVEEHAVRTLYMTEPPRIPDSFADYVSTLLSARNGNGNGRPA